MGISDKAVLLDASVWANKIFTGTWTDAQGGVREVVEPALGKALTKVGIGSVQDIDSAAESAAKAQKAWAQVPPREKAQLLQRAATIFQQHFDELALYIARETGAILPKGQHEVREAITLCSLAASMPMQSQGQVLPSANGSTSLARRVPRGVIGVISPFNFPLILTIRAVAPALAAGNAVIIKPDSRTPVSGGFMMARVFEEAGLPKGLLQVLPGDAETGEALVTHPKVPMIAFTGSPSVGRRIAELAGRHLKKVTLELGGANSLIVLEDADLDIAASNAAWGAFLHQGQICMASNRIIVHESIAKEFTQRVVMKAQHLPVGDGASGQVALGPLIDSRQRDRVHTMVQESVAAGAKLMAGGTSDGLFYKPTVLTDVKAGMRVYDEEVFGPVANIITFKTDEEAVALANNHQGSLAAAVISPSIGRAMSIAAQLNSGMVHINDQTIKDDCVNPFGGPGIAGNGSSVGGPADWEEYTQWQWLTISLAPHAYPF